MQRRLARLAISIGDDPPPGYNPPALEIAPRSKTMESPRQATLLPDLALFSMPQLSPAFTLSPALLAPAVHQQQVAVPQSHQLVNLDGTLFLVPMPPVFPTTTPDTSSLYPLLVHPTGLDAFSPVLQQQQQLTWDLVGPQLDVMTAVPSPIMPMQASPLLPSPDLNLGYFNPALFQALANTNFATAGMDDRTLTNHLVGDFKFDQTQCDNGEVADSDTPITLDNGEWPWSPVGDLSPLSSRTSVGLEAVDNYPALLAAAAESGSISYEMPTALPPAAFSPSIGLSINLANVEPVQDVSLLAPPESAALVEEPQNYSASTTTSWTSLAPKPSPPKRKSWPEKIAKKAKAAPKRASVQAQEDESEEVSTSNGDDEDSDEPNGTKRSKPRPAKSSRTTKVFGCSTCGKKFLSSGVSVF